LNLFDLAATTTPLSIETREKLRLLGEQIRDEFVKPLLKKMGLDHYPIYQISRLRVLFFLLVMSDDGEKEARPKFFLRGTDDPQGSSVP